MNSVESYGPYNVKDDYYKAMDVVEALIETSEVIGMFGRKSDKKTKKLKDLSSEIFASKRAIETIKMTCAQSPELDKLRSQLYSSLEKSSFKMDKLKKMISKEKIFTSTFISKRKMDSKDVEKLGTSALVLQADAARHGEIFLTHNQIFGKDNKKNYNLKTLMSKSDLLNLVSKHPNNFKKTVEERQKNNIRRDNELSKFDSELMEKINRAEKKVEMYIRRGNGKELSEKLNKIQQDITRLKELENFRLKLNYDLENLHNITSNGLDGKSKDLLSKYVEAVDNQLNVTKKSIDSLQNTISDQIFDYEQTKTEYRKEREALKAEVEAQMKEKKVNSHLTSQDTVKVASNPNNTIEKKNDFHVTIGIGNNSNVEKEKKANNNLNMSPELQSLRSVYYQKYQMAKLRDTNLDKVPFSKYLETVAPQEKALIEFEKRNENIYKDYLKYRADCVNKNVSSLSFQNYVIKTLGTEVVINENTIELGETEKERFEGRSK